MTYRRTLTPQQVDAIRRRLEAASLGPWVFSGFAELGGKRLPVIWSRAAQTGEARGGQVDIAWLPPAAESPNQQANAELISAAPQDLALLLETLAAAEGRIRDLEAMLKKALASQPQAEQDGVQRLVEQAQRFPGKPQSLDLAAGRRVDLMLQADGLHLLLSREAEYPTQMEWAELVQRLPPGYDRSAGPLQVQVKRRCYLKSVLPAAADPGAE